MIIALYYIDYWRVHWCWSICWYQRGFIRSVCVHPAHTQRTHTCPCMHSFSPQMEMEQFYPWLLYHKLTCSWDFHPIMILMVCPCWPQISVREPSFWLPGELSSLCKRYFKHTVSSTSLQNVFIPNNMILLIQKVWSLSGHSAPWGYVCTKQANQQDHQQHSKVQQSFKLNWFHDNHKQRFRF